MNRISGYQSVLAEAVVVGLSLAVVGVPLRIVAKKLPLWAFLIVLGAVLHLLYEVSGLNAFYVKLKT